MAESLIRRTKEYKALKKDFLTKFPTKDEYFQHAELGIDLIALFQCPKSYNAMLKEIIKELGYTVLVPISFMLDHDPKTDSMVVVEATAFSDDRTKVISWAVRKNGSVMSKVSGSFCYEPMPSSRTDAFFKKFRFSTAEQARNRYFQKSKLK